MAGESTIAHSKYLYRLRDKGRTRELYKKRSLEYTMTATMGLILRIEHMVVMLTKLISQEPADNCTVKRI